MTNLASGSIDIVPPLAWSEVEPTGFMVMSPDGEPVLPGNRLTLLVPTATILSRPEGTLMRYTFDALTAATPDIPLAARETFRAEVAAVIAAFPTRVFGGASRTIRFRGDALDDQWRVRLQPDGTVARQLADLTWRAPGPDEAKMLAARNEPALGGFGIDGTPASRYPGEHERHCGNPDDHAPHGLSDDVHGCPGGPYAAPGNTKLGKRATK